MNEFILLVKPFMSFSDVTIIGSGVAGLYTSLLLDPILSVTILTKTKLLSGSTKYAQGGIAVVWDKNDSEEKHIQDTMIAGNYHNNKKAVEFLCKNGPKAILNLIDLGLKFDTKNSQIHLTKEAAHSLARIVHLGGDATGLILQNFLIDQVKKRQNIQVIENSLVFEIKKEEDGFDCHYLNRTDESIQTINCKYSVIATGGCGQVFKKTTNPKTATGNGLLLASKLGLKISDMEFYQFHPTALDLPHQNLSLEKTQDKTQVKQSDEKLWENSLNRDFLISEAVRGEGGKLVKACTINNVLSYTRFMHKYDQRMELAPRDIVTRSIWQEMKENNLPSVYLDITNKPNTWIKERFPTIFNHCLEFGLDISKSPIPISPSSHYQMGGITVDLNSETVTANIFAVGEAACTGVHGANRLASNSLLEGLVFARSLADCINLRQKEGKKTSQEMEKLQESEKTEEIKNFEKKAELPINLTNQQMAKIIKITNQIKQIMWENVSVIRTKKSLLKAKKELENIQNENQNLLNQKKFTCIETLSLLTSAKLITYAASLRKESLGSHFLQEN